MKARRFLLWLLSFLVIGCTSPVRKVATHQVAYDFYRARYTETCPAPRKPVPLITWI